ncbi:2,3-bisphosphoglycerate-dependent phosphoglycerate mutase 2 [Tritrichomonas foetus]|uniref:Phosphoglycerate mutase n=1 Tax=Tritrichomonas foetus TaxID=1144522 RepID=A0A1J4JB87_9EUKA|nr:2,3-bisphosphoglycerate-dependent phosphoglycerate mutase 2 [Tritrichomonas foetus]|eukprot:OHS94923.1 2,3-bisphosphoglycerate-dependent phosphoglycerate mutase 2 [Tritrichomonas foetus]
MVAISNFLMEKDFGHLVLVRHGQSESNLAGYYAGWIDCDLTAKGINDAKFAASLLRAENIEFDFAYSSYLKRAIRTKWTILDELDQMYIPTLATWRLNECHCGNFTGLTQKQMIEKYGFSTFHNWREGFTVPPPLLSSDNSLAPIWDPHYSNLDPSVLPLGESLEMAWKRLLPFWLDIVMKNIIDGKNVLVVTHGNIIRAIMKFVEKADQMEKKVMANGYPIVYTFQREKLVGKKILGNKEEREAAAMTSQII